MNGSSKIESYSANVESSLLQVSKERIRSHKKNLNTVIFNKSLKHGVISVPNNLQEVDKWKRKDGNNLTKCLKLNYELNVYNYQR